ncbi:hypothetical protein C8N39_105348 [Dietzia psychralcaliphila]|nr:hypothetical protein C8N39_105348 [Dietzia psychralcaliphila]
MAVNSTVSVPGKAKRMTDIHIVGFLTLWPSTGENPRDYANGYHGLLRLVTAIHSGD